MVTTRAGVDTSSETNSPRVARKRGHQEDRPTSPEAKRKKPSAAGKSVEGGIGNGEPHSVPLRTKNGIPEPTMSPDPAATASRNHIRFSSSSPPPAPAPAPAPIVEPAVAPAEEVAAEEDSDDDAAPEAISHSVAQAQSRAAQAEAVKADRERKNAKKARRRQRDRELRAQVQGSDKRKEKDKKEKQKQNKKEVESEEEEDLLVEDVDAPTKPYSLDNLPVLLPDELLATEAPIRPPTPPPTTKQPGLQNRKIIFASSTAPLKVPQTKAPMDLTVGDMSVRVMAKTNPLLPPKPSESAKSLREGWLKGRSAIARESAKGRKKLSVGGRLQRRPFGGSLSTF